MKRLLWVIFFSLIVHISPFLFFGAHPLGYDTGWYHRYVINLTIAIPNTPVPGLDHTVYVPRLLLDVFLYTGLSPDIVLYGTYILWSGLFLIAFFLWASKIFNEQIALLGTFLLSTSSIQYLGYWEMLYKHSLGTLFLILLFWALESRRGFLSILIAFCIPLTHQTTAIVGLLVLGLSVVFDGMKKKIFREKLLSLGVLAVTYLVLHPHVVQKIVNPPSGIFLDGTTYLLLSLPVFLLLLVHLPNFFRLKNASSLFLGLCTVSLLFPILGLPYGERILLYTDMIVIILASWSVCSFGKSFSQRIRLMVLSFLVTLHVLILVFTVYHRHPLIPPPILSSISETLASVPPGASLITTPRLAPWVQGWSQGKVYAPGLLKDVRGISAWENYFMSSDPKAVSEFLSGFPSPRYLVILPENEPQYIHGVFCLEKISPYLYRDGCQPI